MAYPPLPGLLTLEPELLLPDDELPLLPDDDGEYDLELFSDDELLRGKIIVLPSRLALLRLLLLYCVDGFAHVNVPLVLPAATLALYPLYAFKLTIRGVVFTGAL